MKNLLLIFSVALAAAAMADARTDAINALGVSPERLAKMQRRLEAINATTNRPALASIQTREAAATFRQRLKDALESARKNEDIISLIRERATRKKAEYEALAAEARLQTSKQMFQALATANAEIIKMCDGEEVAE